LQPARPSNAHNPVAGNEADQVVHLPQISPKYFELCLSTSNHKVKHVELDITNITSDGGLFEKIWDGYNKHRGYGVRRYFLRPRDVHFVLVSSLNRPPHDPDWQGRPQFSIASEDSYGAGIHDSHKVYPPAEEVASQRYHYYEPKLVMPAHVFLHFLHKARWPVWGEHTESIWLRRLPKKLTDSLVSQQLRPDLVFGWGAHILEGPNHSVLALFLALLVAATFTTTMAVYGLAGTQEQAFGVGSYLLAVVACFMAAVYFRLMDK
jgi:hypothetical protein